MHLVLPLFSDFTSHVVIGIPFLLWKFGPNSFVLGYLFGLTIGNFIVFFYDLSLVDKVLFELGLLLDLIHF